MWSHVETAWRGLDSMKAPQTSWTTVIDLVFFFSCVTDFWPLFFLFSVPCHHFHFYHFMFYFEVLILLFLVSLYTSCIYSLPLHVDCSARPDSFHLQLVILPFLLQLSAVIPVIGMFVILHISFFFSPCCNSSELHAVFRLIWGFCLRPVDSSVCFAWIWLKTSSLVLLAHLCPKFLAKNDVIIGEQITFTPLSAEWVTQINI